jgi:hypothetical protein
MARIFQKPIYAGESSSRLLLNTGMDSNACNRWAACASAGMDLPSLSGGRLDISAVVHLNDITLDLAYASGLSQDPIRVALLQHAFTFLYRHALPANPRFIAGSDAQFLVIERYLNRTMGARVGDGTLYEQTDTAAREIATMGMVASLASPQARATCWDTVH